MGTPKVTELRRNGRRMTSYMAGSRVRKPGVAVCGTVRHWWADQFEAFVNVDWDDGRNTSEFAADLLEGPPL